MLLDGWYSVPSSRLCWRSRHDPMKNVCLPIQLSDSGCTMTYAGNRGNHYCHAYRYVPTMKMERFGLISTILLISRTVIHFFCNKKGAPNIYLCKPACFLGVSIVLASPGNSWIVGIAVGKSTNLYWKAYFMTDGHEEGNMRFRHKFIVRQIRKTLMRKVSEAQSRVCLECKVHNSLCHKSCPFSCPLQVFRPGVHMFRALTVRSHTNPCVRPFSRRRRSNVSTGKSIHRQKAAK